MITDEELLLYEKLKKEVEIDNRRSLLTKIDERTPKNYKFLYDAFSKQKFEKGKLVAGYKGVVLEGSARSRKTRSVVDFICNLGITSRKRLVVTVIKETYNEFKTTLYNDFNTALDEFGLDNPFSRLKEVNFFKIGKVLVQFIGADQPKKFHGLESDIVYFNEILPLEESVYRAATMRCNLMFICDYNPSVTMHWVFEKVIPREDVGFLRTTFLDNPYLPDGQRIEILGYEPWLPGSYEVRNETDLYYNGSSITETNQPPPHPSNIRNGTADVFYWTVYGLGLRGAMTGVIFNNVVWIGENERPAWNPIQTIDFGFTNDPSGVTNYWEDEHNIWFEPLIYHPIDNSDDLDAACKAVGMKKTFPLIGDSSDKYTGEGKGTVRMVLDMRSKGWMATKVSKTKSVVYWIGSMKRKKIHIIKNRLYIHAKKEQENYRWKEINGISINQPIDSFNHLWDSARYGHMTYNNNATLQVTTT